MEQARSQGSTVLHSEITIQSLPVELIFDIFTYFKLKTYIIAHGVCKEWRRLLPLAPINPVRRRLFQLYQNMINTPDFIKTRVWIVDNLAPFDRQAYIDALLSQYPAIPEEFRIWILEWPARAVIACMWPGLPFSVCYSVGPQRRYGVNWLGYKKHSPKLLAPIYCHGSRTSKFSPALLIWRATYITEYLSFDESEPALFGRVVVKDYMEHQSPALIFHHRGAIYMSGDKKTAPSNNDENSYTLSGSFPDWICYLEYQWAITVEQIHYVGSSQIDTGFLIEEDRVMTCFNQDIMNTRPTMEWTERQRFLDHLTFPYYG
uniref:F-box domain-containing protein n=1 Tax=Psilocybe cubensis TaxID=181762 RepID=A0A8H7Y8S6_PSICU